MGSIVSGSDGITGVVGGFSGIVDGISEGLGLVSGASFEDTVPVVLQPAVGDEDGIDEGPDTTSTEGDGLEGSHDDVSEVESIDTGHGSDGGEGEHGSDLVG